MEQEIIVLTGSGLFDLGVWVGAGAATGAAMFFGVTAALSLLFKYVIKLINRRMM